MRQVGVARSWVCRLVASTCAILVAASQGAMRLSAQSGPPTFKIAYFNIQSGKGEQPLPGRSCPFAENTNCTDPSRPMNAWGLGIVQAELRSKLADPSVIALGLGEAWSCANPAAVRTALGWAATSTIRNGVAIVARYGFAGPEEWLQLDTSLNATPSDTMWVLKVPVCLNASCSSSVLTFTAHWYGKTIVDADSYGVYEKQARQTIEFLDRFAGQPRVLIGDLNVFEGTALMCLQFPLNKPVQMMRDAGYVDAWNGVHGLANGNTGMWNRPGCGSPEGAPWKRIDFSWSQQLNPVSMTRFGMVTPGECAPSDHAGILIEYQTPLAPGSTVPPSVTLVSPDTGQTVSGSVNVEATATDDEGVSRVELLIDGVGRHVTTTPPYRFSWDSLMVVNGTHTIEAAATDTSGNRSLSGKRTIFVDNRGGVGDELVLYARDATAVQGNWSSVALSSAAGGRALYNTELAQPRLGTALPSPADFVELSFTAKAGTAYRLWIRGSALSDSIDNDSVHVQFSGSVSSSGSPVYRIGTSSSTVVSIEDCNGCGLSGWGWQDNASGGRDILGPLVYFETSGSQRIRIQRREDGFQFDQVVLSAVAYLHASPGLQQSDSTILPATNGGSPPPPPPPPPSGGEIVLYAGTPAVVAGAWTVVADTTAAGGKRLQSANAGGAKLTTPLAAPAHYFELTFNADAGKPYRLWIRGKAIDNHYANDSAFVQFDRSVDGTGATRWRIGTTSATTYVLEDCSGCGLSGWGWQDNGYGAGVLGPEVYFAGSGAQRLRIQVREDGLGIDQVVLSPVTYLSRSPGTAKDDTTILPPSGGGTPPPPPSSDEVVIYASSSAAVAGSWLVTGDLTAAGGAHLQNPDAGAPKLTAALAAPAHYFDVTFNAAAGKPYRLWIRGKALANNYQNDSAFVQFDGSVSSTGVPQWRIGSTSATVYILEDCSGCGVSGWGWQDNGYGTNVLGPAVYFASSGLQRMRVQVREDGLGIDQIVLSAVKYLTVRPGAARDDSTILPK
jgi:Bacterial Ig domain